MTDFKDPRLTVRRTPDNRDARTRTVILGFRDQCPKPLDDIPKRDARIELALPVWKTGRSP